MSSHEWKSVGKSQAISLVFDEWMQMDHQINRPFHCLCIDKSMATADELNGTPDSHIIVCDYATEAINSDEIEGMFECHQVIFLPSLGKNVYIRSLSCYCSVCRELHFDECLHKTEVGEVKLRTIKKIYLVSQAIL